MKKITKAEEAFCQAFLANNCNATVAYKAAYNVSRMKPITINKRASEERNKPQIKARIVELQDVVKEQAAAEFGITSETKLRWLTSIVEDAMAAKTGTSQDKDGNEIEIQLGMRSHSGAISAIDQINKMDGGHAAQRIDMNATISQAERVKALKEKRK